jgi:SAM-dependent methyltransferase
VVQYDAQATFWQERCFDVVCDCDIIHHVEEPLKALANWLKAVKPGGRPAFFGPNPWNLPLYLRTFRRPEEARFRYSTRGNLMRWLIAAGWQSPEVRSAPIYMPNGPRMFWPVLGAAETSEHKIPPLRLVSGGFLPTVFAA